MPPSTGVVSILKSPVCTTTPQGVLMAREQASTIEWLTGMNSTEKQPASKMSLGETRWILTFESSLCSASFSSTRPAVSFVQ